jgi:hypothetical protein
MAEPDGIGWSRPREGLLIAAVDKRIVALFYWHPQSRSWFGFLLTGPMKASPWSMPNRAREL